MNANPISLDTKVATVGGTLLTVFEHINPTDISKTIVLAVLGAVVSFTASLICRMIWERLNGKLKNKHKDESK